MDKKTIITVIVLFVVLAAVLLLLIPVQEKNERYAKWGTLAEEAETNPMAEFIIENEELYTDSILSIYYIQPEKLEFVYNYAFHKDDYDTMTFTDEELNAETIPALYMSDPRWGYEYIYDETISEMGCSAVALTMANLYLNHNGDADPVKFIELAKTMGAISMFEMVDATYISDIAAAFGMKAEGVLCYEDNHTTGVDHNDLIEILDAEDTVLMANMMSEPFGKHMIIIRGYCNEGYYINDPAGSERTEQIWDFDLIENGIAYYWKITKK
ncbi:MAG: C39 family peptidase [Oscillospiraceae bacterium]